MKWPEFLLFLCDSIKYIFIMCHLMDLRDIRCKGGSLHAIRKGLLSALNLQVEPQLPAGGLDGIRQQWRSTFSNIAHSATDTTGQ